MRLYVFKSETRKLFVFAADPVGSRFPEHYGSWTVIGIVGSMNTPPHNISRETVEKAIESQGFQLWRMAKAKSDA